jgi:hypothetical protein
MFRVVLEHVRTAQLHIPRHIRRHVQPDEIRVKKFQKKNQDVRSTYAWRSLISPGTFGAGGGNLAAGTCPKAASIIFSASSTEPSKSPTRNSVALAGKYLFFFLIGFSYWNHLQIQRTHPLH